LAAERRLENANVSMVLVCILIAFTSILVAQTTGSTQLLNFGYIYAFLGIVGFAGMLHLRSMGWEWFWAPIISLVLTGAFVTAAVLVLLSTVISPLMGSFQAFGTLDGILLIVKEMKIPSEILVTVGPGGEAVLAFYLSLANFLGIDIRLLISIVMMLPAAFCESTVFHVYFPEFLEQKIGYIPAIALSNAGFGLEHLAYGRVEYCLGAGTLGLIISIGYTYFGRSELVATIGHLSYNLVCLFTNPLALEMIR